MRTLAICQRPSRSQPRAAGTALAWAPALLVLAACNGVDAGASPAVSKVDGAPMVSDGGALLDGAQPDTDASAADAGVDAADTSPGGPTPESGADSAPPATGCSAILIDSTTQVDRSGADSYTWSDTQCRPRTAALLRNEAPDAFGEWGGYVRRFTYEFQGHTRTCTGSGTNGWNGFGYIVNHWGNTASTTQNAAGKHSIVLAGRHHVIHQYTWRITSGGPIDVTAQWVFATGRDHPLFSITFDAQPAGANVVSADTRAPYGDLGWDNDSLGEVAGVAWGDKYQFKTIGAGPLTPSSAWDYTQANIIPFNVEWSAVVDAEMGLVATQAWETKVEGGDYGGGMIMGQWTKTGTNLLTDIPDWEWLYQLNQYELPFTTKSHRLAWGANYGAVGQSSYTAFGKTISGYPFQSYAVYVVLGSHSAKAVESSVHEMETVQAVTFTASRGTVSAEGPAGVARTDTGRYTPPGFDPVYAVWDARAANNAATLTLTVPSGVLTNPMVRIHDYTAMAAPSRVTVNGKLLVADMDYFASVDSATSSLWLTLNRALAGGSAIAIDP